MTRPREALRSNWLYTPLKSQPALACQAISGLPFIVQRNGFAMVALK